ncbi:right-handed parallel beta-helix repeat-containing protein [Geodermatophilus sp. SYSU D00691]
MASAARSARVLLPLALLLGLVAYPVPLGGDDRSSARTPPAADEQPATHEPTEPRAPGRDSAAAGSSPVGWMRYPVPADAVHVSPSGSDTADGTAAAPYRTVARALAAAPSGATVVLRGGNYSESATIPRGKRLTVQAAPGEVVWLDGSEVMTGWVADGSAWRVGWTIELDHSPTYTPGAPDNTEPGWAFLDPAYPLAAHPEQVFVDGVAQQQVTSRSAVVPGAFYVDADADRLYLGTDPAGHEVRASVLRTGLTVLGAGSVVRGIGIRRYATPVPDKGALRLLAPDVSVENVVVQDNATQGIYVGGRGQGVRTALRSVTAERNGMLGVESSYADGLVVDGLRAVGNNTEHFNAAPVSGGMKITRARGIVVTDGVFADNLGPGLWFDESVHGATIVGNDLVDNAGHGLSFEISSTALIADNVVARNGGNGLKLNNSSSLEVWNNTVVGNGQRPIWLVQDSRVASDLTTPGHDPRRPLPDPTVTWLLGPATLKNNVIAGPTAADCLLCVQDGALRRSADQIAVTADGNVYVRTGAGAPLHTATWPAGSATPHVYPTLADFRAGTGQEGHGIELVGRPATDGDHRLTAAVAAQEAAVAQPLPAAVASRAGLVAGSERLGARFD